MTNEELVTRIQNGDESKELYAELYSQNTGIIRLTACKVLHRYKATESKEMLEDMMQEGYFALLEAVKRYDTSKGTFITYFSYWVEGVLQKYFHKYLYCIVMPANVKGHRKVMSLDRPFDDSEGCLYDVLPDPDDHISDVVDKVEREQFASDVWKCVDALPDQQANALRLHFKGCLTYREIAGLTGESYNRVHSHIDKGLQQLRRDKTIKHYKSDAEVYSAGLKMTGLSSFRRTGWSSVERAVISSRDDTKDDTRPVFQRV